MFRRNRKLTEISDDLHAPDGIEPLDLSDLHGESDAVGAISKLFDVYQPGVVFSEPITVDDNTVITAAEVYVAMGLGFGHGSGNDDDGGSGEGSGGGGGGGSAGRPVAAIIIGPKGVQVEPIVDVTKIALAFFTTIGAMFMMWRAMRRQR
ncbi:MAG: hypothetical protein IT328_00370 [Caldilineaceae bacterium]|nr:hypothetical protein [Caldilineaceae bacterium]